MNKMLLSLVTVFVMLGSSVLAQASPTSGWWEVRNTDQSAAGYSTGSNLCIKADGKWYMNLKQNGLLTAVKGDWVNVADLTLFVGLNESVTGVNKHGGTSGQFASAFVLKRINSRSMRGAYIYSNKGSGFGDAYDNLLTYKGLRCAPMKKVNAPVVKKYTPNATRRTWQNRSAPNATRRAWQNRSAQKQTVQDEYNMKMSNDYTGSNMCLTARGSVVRLARCTNKASSMWAVVPTGKYYLIKNKTSGVGRCLGIYQGGLLTMGVCRPDLNFQLWSPEFLKGSPQRTRLRNKAAKPGQCLAVASQNGRNTPRLLKCGNYGGQRWF